MAPRIKKTTTGSADFEASNTKDFPLVQSKRKMNENGKRSDDKLSFLKTKKNDTEKWIQYQIYKSIFLLQ